MKSRTILLQSSVVVVLALLALRQPSELKAAEASGCLDGCCACYPADEGGCNSTAPSIACAELPGACGLEPVACVDNDWWDCGDLSLNFVQCG